MNRKPIASVQFYCNNKTLSLEEQTIEVKDGNLNEHKINHKSAKNEKVEFTAIIDPNEPLDVSHLIWINPDRLLCNL